MTSLFDPGMLGDIQIANRVVMAPMTRSRAGDGDVPTDLHVEYYRQRAGAGLIITEGTQPSPAGKGYCRTPGIHSSSQIKAWRKVTDAVHAEGGKIVLQLMHVGRVASHLNKAPGVETIAPSAIQAAGEMFTESGMVPLDTPRAIETDEIPSIIEEYASAARNAVQAGFDGVELHCTSGYLPAQFLSSGSNHRTDGYGGPAANRIRFVVETIQALSRAIGSERVGFRICPGNPFNDIHDDDPVETYGLLLKTLSPLGLAYLHLIDWPNPQIESLPLAQSCWQGPLILNESITLERAKTLISGKTADAVSFGRPFIANPDLVLRFRKGLPLAEFDPNTLYSPGPEGYVTYPPAEIGGGVAD
ncbi:alkene reductase [Novosphingobium naphthalenivorans]|uniref:alkene reductase n=1 Tax=Novosphingobium naphthalenivorans TaxID=273168 RepID=UPI000831EB5C|nr:alkene reductase [Novosphingobium naphthalenivorans]